MKNDNVFKLYKIKPGESEEIQFADTRVKLIREEEGWQITTYENKDEEKETGSNYFQTGASDQVILAPALHAKPLVFKGSGLMVMPKQRLNFFLRIPLLMQVYHSRKHQSNLMKEIAHKRLSDTWFGDPDNGEPAYSVGSEYFLTMDDVPTDWFYALCPVSVYNNWDSALELQRLIIRVENLTLFEVKNKIISSQVKIEYKGKDTISSADYVTAKTYHGEKQHILAKARNESGNLVKINFHFIRNIYKNM